LSEAWKLKKCYVVHICQCTEQQMHWAALITCVILVYIIFCLFYNHACTRACVRASACGHACRRADGCVRDTDNHFQMGGGWRVRSLVELCSTKIIQFLAGLNVRSAGLDFMKPFWRKFTGKT
jgi:hypothetical protein